MPVAKGQASLHPTGLWWLRLTPGRRGLEFRVQSVGFGGLGFRIWGFRVECRALGLKVLGFGVEGRGLGLRGLGFRVQSSLYRV